MNNNHYDNRIALTELFIAIAIFGALVATTFCASTIALSASSQPTTLLAYMPPAAQHTVIPAPAHAMPMRQQARPPAAPKQSPVRPTSHPAASRPAPMTTATPAPTQARPAPPVVGAAGELSIPALSFNEPIGLINDNSGATAEPADGGVYQLVDEPAAIPANGPNYFLLAHNWGAGKVWRDHLQVGMRILMTDAHGHHHTYVVRWRRVLNDETQSPDALLQDGKPQIVLATCRDLGSDPMKVFFLATPVD